MGVTQTNSAQWTREKSVKMADGVHGGTWRQDGRRRVLLRQSHFPHVGESEFFEGDDVVGVKSLSHEGIRM